MDDLRERAWKLQCDIQSMGENDQREIIEHAFRTAVEAETERCIAAVKTMQFPADDFAEIVEAIRRRAE